MIEIEDISFKKQPFTKEQIQSIYSLIVSKENKKQGNLTILFMNDDDLLKINQEHLKHDFYTDIITFNYNEKDLICGEVLISLDRVLENSIKYKQNFNKELLRVIIHGILHLCDYNDKGNLEKQVMRFKENYYLNTFVSRETLKDVRQL